ncbi:hemagglutinin repeat-containing protein [Psychrobacter ciconiae]|uniref:hemagglutinin repeat-containing protein n=1 Tax=Psychrobacter ciconiae TaxID=1553449 RepID=UPI00191A1655|nr:hemagglutinin repeat-containing protein [Psychrobacter ciconiae]
MLDRLKLDPTLTQKRLGDGYYEQQYVRDQIMMLTGRYYLGNYRDQDAQFQGLMDSGLIAAQTLSLRPGIALTAEQVARLTTDIVWLVQQNITLADGSIQRVLVPKVYTRQAVGQIDGTGNLIAADRIDLQLSGNLGNQGNIVGHQQVKISANNLTNENGGLIKGNFVQISTQNDLNNLSSALHAGSAMQLNVGGNFNHQSLTYSTESVKGASNGSRTGMAQIASIYVGDGLKGQSDTDGNPLTTFAASVGGNTTFSGAQLTNQGGRSVIDSKGDINLNAVNVGYQSNSIGDTNNYYKQGEARDVGSNLTGSSDIIVKAGNNVTGTATQISSDLGAVGIKAGNNINFTEGRHTQNLSTASKTVDKGVFSKKTTQNSFEHQSDNAIASNIEGNTVALQAGNNISLTGTNAISDRGTSLTAGSNIDILAAKNTSSESAFNQTKKSGLFGTDGGIGFTLGRQQTDNSNAQTTLTHSASNIAALDGNVIINAGGSYQQTGSNLIAAMGADSDNVMSDPNRGNTVIRAKSINIDNALDIYTNQNQSQSKQSGLTVSVSNSLIDNAQSISSLIDAAKNTESVRMKGLAAVSSLLKVQAIAKQTGDAINGISTLGNTRIQATLGSQNSQSNSSSYSEVNQASTITTGNLALIATGAGTGSNININGSNLNVTSDALFQADNDFNVNGVAQRSSTRSDNKSSSAAIGGYASTGNGVGITANASRGKGYANSDSVTYANTQVNVGGTSTFDIGRDLNIKGGVFNTGSAQGQIRGDVNIESLQDTYSYDSNQKNIGFSADIDLKGKGSSLSVNGSKTNINADHKAVGQQSGLFTKDGGIDLTVEGKTTLIGGAITTTKAAQQAGRNNYTSLGGITTQDIENTSRYKGDALSVGLSLGNTTGKPQANMNGLGYGTDSDNQTSITRSGITGTAGNSGITTDNRAEYAGILENNFDVQRVNEELAAQTQITREFGKEAPKAVAEFSQNRINAIKADPSLSVNEKLVAIAKWDEGGIYRVAAHTALGALGTGSLEGALTTGGVAAAAPTLDKVQEKIAESLIASGMSEDIANGTASGVISLTLLGAGSVAGLDTSSTVTAVNVDANNRQLHPQEADLIKILALEYARKHGISIEEAEKRLTRGALYNIDAGWKDSIDTYIDDKEIESYQEAFNYINQVKPSDLNAYDWADIVSSL